MSEPEVLNTKSRIFEFIDRVGARPLVNDLYNSSQETFWHSARVAIISREIAGLLTRNRTFADIVGTAGMLHDVGKTDPEIAATIALDRRLTPKEKALVDQHTSTGMRMLAELKENRINDKLGSYVLGMSMMVARNHHEDITEINESNSQLVIAAAVVQAADRIDARYDPSRSRYTKRIVTPEDDTAYGAFIAGYLLHPSEHAGTDFNGQRLLDSTRLVGVSYRHILGLAHDNWSDVYRATASYAESH